MTTLHLGTDADLRPIDARYRAIFADQATRITTMLGGLSDEQWQAPSRNSAWTVQHTMQHVSGVRIENARLLDGDPPTWPRFDPSTTPQFDIDLRAGESPQDTTKGFVDATQRLVAHLDARSDSNEQRPMLWGEPADFRLFFIHVLWDSFLHERDVTVPLGLDHEPSPEQLSFATAYGLLIASVAIRMSGGSLDTTIAIDDVGHVGLDVDADHIRVTIADDATGAASLHAPAAAPLLDALSGRGTVADVLSGPDEEVAALSMFAAFLNR